MRTLFTRAGGGRRWAPARRHHAWVATWLQDQRRGRQKQPVLQAQYPSLAVWEWTHPNPYRWNAYHQINGVGPFVFDDWVWGNVRQYAPDGGQHPMYIVGVDASGQAITLPSNIVRPDDASAVPTASLRLWLAPDFLTELAGEDVLSWPDLSALSNDLGEHTAVAVYPVRSASVFNGYAGVKFARRDEFEGDIIGALKSNAPVWSGAEPRSMYVVYALNDVEDYGAFDYDLGQCYVAAVAGQTTPTVNQSWYLMERPDVGPNCMPFLTGWAADYGFGSSQVFNTPRLATVTYDGTNGRGYVNGVLNATSAKSYNTTPVELSLGALNDGQNSFFGDVLELLAYGAVHNGTTRTAIESYLMNKYEVTP